MRTDYVIRRVLMVIPTLLLVYTLTFFLMHSTPGGPWDTSEKPIPASVQEKLKAAYGLDKPVWQQYVDFLGRALHGDLGPSYAQRSRTVSDIIGETFPVSLQLGAAAILVAAVIGIPLGILGAVKHNHPLDYVATFVSVFGVSTPPYVATSLLVLV